MQRRSFLKNTCNICLLGAAGYSLPLVLNGCKTASYSVYKTPVNGKTVQVPLSLFTTTTTQFVRPNGWYRDIAVQKKEDGSYYALLLECTHQENALTPTSNGYHCSLHGSDFDKNGNVRKGPAEQSLTKYNTVIQENNLIIYI